MNERFDDYIREGKSENESYSLVIANMGDVDELLKEVLPDADFKKEAQFYRTRNARNTAIGVALYIIGAAIVVGSSSIPGISSRLAVVVLLILVAIATGLIVFTNMSTPSKHKNLDKKENYRDETQRGRIFRSWQSVLWSITTVIYFAISFATGNWHIT